jgi:hypothetical protein
MQYKSIEGAAASSIDVAPAPSGGTKVRLVSYVIANSGASAASFRFKSGSTYLSGALSIPAGGFISAAGGESYPGGAAGLFEGLADSSVVLEMTTGQATSLGGHCTYQIVN